ncbi:hypothetical protein BXY85_1428 [Roseivirga pacifica]|uniref:Uncharacterized protein n=1 Tax=Roseivirga pacifica TaxID=1267423 RepID=A0A1I0MHQ3_9BACT|nr:hypothetical protein [Roseivirga pacifica]RKQ50413.1 hypothetical protein BXY85_1428 [Roseivirga pacifica]SEV87883.1 hypothetical protein SAMN05216290_0412 [Roseivirga pacifica]
MGIFDHTFLTIYKFYKKREKNYGPLGSAITYLSFLQFLVIYAFLFILEMLFSKSFSLIDLLRSLGDGGYFYAIGLYVLIDICNQFRYRRKGFLEKLTVNYKNSPVNRWIKAWHFIVIGFVLLFIPPYLLSVVVY